MRELGSEGTSGCAAPELFGRSWTSASEARLQPSGPILQCLAQSFFESLYLSLNILLGSMYHQSAIVAFFDSILQSNLSVERFF
jgi:hypothetical protein